MASSPISQHLLLSDSAPALLPSLILHPPSLHQTSCLLHPHSYHIQSFHLYSSPSSLSSIPHYLPPPSFNNSSLPHSFSNTPSFLYLPTSYTLSLLWLILSYPPIFLPSSLPSPSFSLLLSCPFLIRHYIPSPLISNTPSSLFAFPTFPTITFLLNHSLPTPSISNTNSTFPHYLSLPPLSLLL